MSDKPAFDPSKPFEAAEAPTWERAKKPKFDPSKPFETPKPKPTPLPDASAGGGILSEGVDGIVNTAKQIGRGVQVAAKFIDEKVDQPLREKLGLPRTGADLVKKYGISDAPLVSPDLPKPGALPTNSAEALSTLLFPNYKKIAPTDPGEAAMSLLPRVPRSKAAEFAYENTASTVNLIPPLVAAVKFFRPAAAAKLEGMAVKAAENATGATAVQAEKFAPGSGKMLLDEGIVSAGKSQAGIAKAAAEAREAAGKNIGAVVKELEAAGAPLSDRQELGIKMLDRAEELKNASSQVDRDTGKALERIAEEFSGAKNKSLPISEVEREKSAFDKLAKWDIQNPTPSTGRDAYREAANLLRSHVEGIATQVEPGLAEIFKHEKQLYGALTPIEKAAERRALVTNQSPWAGIQDIVAGSSVGPAVGTAVTHMTGNPVIGGAAGLISGMGAAASRRVIAPRLASTAADVLYKGSKLLGAEFVKPLESFVQAGSIPMATVSRIMETPEGRGVMKEILKDVAVGNTYQPKQSAPPGAIERLKRRTQKKGN